MSLLRLFPSSCLLAVLSAASARAATGPRMAAERAALAQRAERELRGDILPFWLKHTRNPATGGFFGLIDADMRVDPSAPRGALLTSRILWTFSRAYSVYRDPAYLEMAQWAYRDLRDHFRDAEEGGLYWTITAAGRPLDLRKQIYGEAFGIYALAEYHRATGDASALQEAIELYRLVERHARDQVHGGYFDALNRDWSRRADNLLGPGPKSQNSHIHILEAYTNLLRSWPDPGLRAAQHELIEVTLDHLIDPRTHHLILFLADDWTPLSRTVSYGHDIELSWLIAEAGRVQADSALIARIRPVALAMAEATLAEGVDADGGVVNEGGPGGYIDANKDWWPQAEAAVGFVNAWQESGDGRFFAAARRSWDLIEAKFVDRVHGDWIGSITREGVPRPQPKVSLWKCP
ncbi:MAG TPA: AGE family epimerase/isomerase, partial [Opitutaceae bacterium]|nr:AGE family epimerase/isomerase [Opitutaceae bacterium]